MRTIQGDIKPKAEQKTLYELSTIILNFTSSVFSPQKEEKYVWTLYKLVDNQWKKVENNVKYGEKNTYQFGQGVVGIPFKIMVHSEEKDILQVNRNKLIAELTVVPKTAKEPVIGRVILLNKGNKDVNKAKFNEHLTAQARTSNLLGKEITFYLWEEGASEFEKYKNPKKARVNKHGIAEVQFNLSEYASPATFMIFFGGNNATKKFFVTATYEGKGETNKTPVIATDRQQQTTKTNTISTQQKPQQSSTPQPTQAPNNQGAGIIAKSREIIAEGIGNFFNAIENSISAAQVGTTQRKEEKKNCGQKFCIKRGDKGELIREINIRLSGFGGNVPTDEFTDRTEKMVKQFQRDYMKVPETGKVCGNVLKAIDEFQSRFTIDFTEIKCKCKKCTGFGDGSNKGKYLKDKKEAYHRYEYPGIYRSLLSSIRAVKFYLSKDGRFSFNKVNSGYRCRFHEEYLKKPTTNHMGKALDLHFNDKKGRTKRTPDMETIRQDIFHKYLGAKWDWNERNIFNLESTEKGAKTWIHYDVREFDQSFLEDKFFVKTLQQLNGKSIVALAVELGYSNTCNCMGAGIANIKEKDITKKDNKYKWAHSEFGNLIAMRESSDNYNKCNKTKGGLKEVNNLNLADLTVGEIQEKQKNRDLFAVGRYQLIPITLNGAISNLKLNLSDKMDKDKQDEIFDDYLIKVKRPKIISYLEGNGNLEDAMYSAAQEWASIGVEKGKRISDKVTKDKKGNVISREIRYSDGTDSYYQGDGLNQAHITPEQIKKALINSKNANK